MKLRTGILVLGMMAGTVWAQNPDVIQNTRDTLQNVQKKQAIDQNAALAAAGQASTPTPVGQPTAAPKPAPSKPATNNASAVASQNKPVAPANKAAVNTPANSSKSANSEKKPVAAPAVKPAANASADKPKAAAQKKTAKKQTKTVVAVAKPSQAKQTVAVEDKKAPEESKKKEPRQYSAAGRRDPFISPVVSHSVTGSGCSSGKRCLAVDQIILTGIVKSETGMIAVVVNSLNKAYFLRENDPVFNGYVVKITGDSIIFNQTFEDKLGKPFTREVTKKIATPAV
jgi:Tfp pilus assembly protein PilP